MAKYLRHEHETPPRLQPLVVRHVDAEVLGATPDTIRLLANGPDCGAFISATRVQLGPGRGGATPHRHRSAAELFFILDGALQVLLGDGIVTARPGDTLVVPPTRSTPSAPHPARPPTRSS